MTTETESRIVAGALCIGFVVLFAVLISSLVELWPFVTQVSHAPGARGATAETNRQTIEFAFGLFSLSLTPSTGLLVLVILMGAIGSFVHIATSLADFVGNRRFRTSWLVWYVLRSFIGVALAVLLYVAFRAGLFTSNAMSSDVNPYGIAAVGGLAGLFSKQATDKLQEVFETLFRVSSNKGDAQRSDDLAAPVPVLSKLDPASITAGSGNTEVTATGTGFDQHAVARVAGADQETTVKSPSELVVTVPAAAITDPGQIAVTVLNPPPGGGTSNALSIEVTP